MQKIWTGYSGCGYRCAIWQMTWTSYRFLVRLQAQSFPTLAPSLETNFISSFASLCLSFCVASCQNVRVLILRSCTISSFLFFQCASFKLSRPVPELFLRYHFIPENVKSKSFYGSYFTSSPHLSGFYIESSSLSWRPKWDEVRLISAWRSHNSRPTLRWLSHLHRRPYEIPICTGSYYGTQRRQLIRSQL